MRLSELLAGPVLQAAEGLLGRRLTSRLDGVAAAVIITEVEAYAGENDPASHAYRGRTPRNAIMFGPPGGLYVYRSYGIHWCMNVVCGAEGVARAVLLRGGIPEHGVEVMEERRGRRVNLTDGPGKLCQALGVNGDHHGTNVFDGPISISGVPVRGVVGVSPRIGLSKAVDRAWRFVLQPTTTEG